MEECVSLQRKWKCPQLKALHRDRVRTMWEGQEMSKEVIYNFAS